MYEFVSGRIDSLSPTSVVVDAGGIGYLLQIDARTYGALQGQTEVRLFIHFVVREDAQEFYGFLDPVDRQLFRLLIGTSGVGPNTARTLLSAYETSELVGIIQSGDANALKRAKGVGAKTAQRLIVDLQDKVVDLDGVSATRTPRSGVQNHDAVMALVTLGFPKNACEKMVSTLLKETPDLGVEQIIKQALKRM